jgi:hypothetical protein
VLISVIVIDGDSIDDTCEVSLSVSPILYANVLLSVSAMLTGGVAFDY